VCRMVDAPGCGVRPGFGGNGLIIRCDIGCNLRCETEVRPGCETRVCVVVIIVGPDRVLLLSLMMLLLSLCDSRECSPGCGMSPGCGVYKLGCLHGIRVGAEIE